MSNSAPVKNGLIPAVVQMMSISTWFVNVRSLAHYQGCRRGPAAGRSEYHIRVEDPSSCLSTQP